MLLRILVPTQNPNIQGWCVGAVSLTCHELLLPAEPLSSGSLQIDADPGKYQITTEDPERSPMSRPGRLSNLAMLRPRASTHGGCASPAASPAGRHNAQCPRSLPAPAPPSAPPRPRQRPFDCAQPLRPAPERFRGLATLRLAPVRNWHSQRAA